MSDFSGIWLAAPILELADLNLTEKVILSQVITLSRESECNAGNKYLAAITKVTETTVSLTLTKLKGKNYLHIEDGKEEGNKRTMYPSLKTLNTLFKNLKEGDAGSLKIFKTLYKNFKEALLNIERPYLKILNTLFKNFKELIYRIDNKDYNKGDNIYYLVNKGADALFWAVLLVRSEVHKDKVTYSRFVKTVLKPTLKKSPPVAAAPPEAGPDQFAYEHAAGKWDVVDWPVAFSESMRTYYLTDWLPYHRKRSGKRLTTQGVKEQLKDLASLDEAGYMQCLSKAIKFNWQSFHVNASTISAQNPVNDNGSNFGQGAILPSGSAYRAQTIGRNRNPVPGTPNPVT